MRYYNQTLKPSNPKHSAQIQLKSDNSMGGHYWIIIINGCSFQQLL